MIIYKKNNYEYTSDQLLLNEPLCIEGAYLYPIKSKQWHIFIEYGKYLMFNEKHLGLNSQKDLLYTILLLIIQEKVSEQITDEEKSNEIKKQIDNFANMFSIVTHSNIEFNEDDFCFYNNDGIIIDSNNYDIIRQGILKINLMKEPKVFDDPLVQKYYEKTIRARQREKGVKTLGEMMLIISQDMKIPIDDIGDFNIFQIYAYYNRILHVEEYKVISIIRCFSEKAPKIAFNDSIIDNLFKDESLEDMVMSESDLGNIISNQ